MHETLQFESFISRARGNRRFIEIEVIGKKYRLYRDNRHDLENLALLLRSPRALYRSSLEAYELRGLEVYGEFWLDAECDTDLAWIAPVGEEAITPGPSELNAAAMILFNRPFRTRVGRSPRAMAECRGGVCADCGAPAQHAHHLVPAAMGGEDARGNLAPLCASCHGRRHRGSGVIRISKTRSMIEVLGVLETFLFWSVVKVSVLPEKREYQAVWARELVAPERGVYDANIKWVNGALNVLYAEPVSRVAVTA